MHLLADPSAWIALLTLTAEAFDQHISKGYIYFAMGFALLVELLNIRLRRRQRPTVNAPAT